jgi:translation initiation factor 1
MTKKKIQSLGGLVYSTDPDFKLARDDAADQEIIIPSEQKLKIRLDTKHRAGKAVTLVEGFIGTFTDIEELGKKLKSFCGTGGSVKDGEIIVQGDNREKILQWLQKNGYKLARKI